MLRYILLPLLAISASAFVLERNLCKQAGFFAPIDNARTFYGCYPKKEGGFTLKVLTCPAEQVFNVAAGHCVTKMKLQAADVDDFSPIENPTTPPPSSSSKQPDIENPTVPTQSTTENFNDSTDETTDEPTNTTEEPSQPTESTDEPTGSTDEPTGSTDEPTESTDEPTGSTDEPTGSTDEPTGSTDEPTGSTDEPTQSTDEPTESTDDPTESTDEPTESTDDPTESTDEPTEPTAVTKEPETTEEPGTTGEPETTDDQTESTDETTNGTEQTPTAKPFICPTKGFFPANGACNEFIYCMPKDDDNEPIELTCPDNQNFNPSTLFCDANYDCDDDGEIEIVAQIEFDCVMEGIFPDHKDQAKYFVCTWNEKAKSFKYEHKICDEKEIFHRLTGKCGRHLQLPKALSHLGH